MKTKDEIAAEKERLRLEAEQTSLADKAFEAGFDDTEFVILDDEMPPAEGGVTIDAPAAEAPAAEAPAEAPAEVDPWADVNPALKNQITPIVHPSDFPLECL